MDNWMMVAAKLACTTGNIKETSDYEDYDLEQRLKLCKVQYMSVCVCTVYMYVCVCMYSIHVCLCVYVQYTCMSI